MAAVILCAIAAAVAFLVYRLRCRREYNPRGSELIDMSRSANSSSIERSKTAGDASGGTGLFARSPFVVGHPATPPFAQRVSAPIGSKVAAEACSGGGIGSRSCTVRQGSGSSAQRQSLAQTYQSLLAAAWLSLIHI